MVAKNSSQFSLTEFTRKIYGSAQRKIEQDNLLPSWLKKKTRKSLNKSLLYASSLRLSKARRIWKPLSEQAEESLLSWCAAANSFCLSIADIDYYKEELKRRFGKDRLNRFEKTHEDEYSLEDNDIHFLQRFLMDLVSFDPLWIYDPRVESFLFKINEDARVNFFAMLGGCIADKKKKGRFIKASKDQKINKILNYVKGAMEHLPAVPIPPGQRSAINIEGKKISTHGDLLVSLQLKGLVDGSTSYTPHSLRRLLERYGLSLSKQMKTTGYLKLIQKEKRARLKEVLFLKPILSRLLEKTPLLVRLPE